MINVSAECKEALSASMKTVYGRVVIHGKEEDYEFTANDALTSIAIEQEGQYFLSSVKSGSIALAGDDLGIFSGLACDVYAEVVVSRDVETGAITTEDIAYGRFFITEQKTDLEKGTTTLTIMDTVGIMLNTTYKRGDFAFPSTVASLIEQVADHFGVNLATDVASLPNAQETIDAPGEGQLELFEESAETTYRDVLDMLAGITGTVARAGVAGLEFIQPAISTTVDTLDWHNYLTVKVGGSYGNVNSVVIAREPQEDNVIYPVEVEGDRVDLRLTNNEIIEYGDVEDARRLRVAERLYQVVNGLGWTGFEATTEGHGYYQIGDRITTSNTTTGETFESVITYIKLVIAGSLKETLKSEVPTVEETDYSTAGSSVKSVWNVQIKTDKQQGEINSLVSKTDHTNEVVQQNYTQFLQTVNAITQTIQKAGGSNLIQNSVGYNVNADGSLVSWETVGDVSSMTSQESKGYGAVSGNQISLLPGGKITQRVNVAVGGSYAFSAYVKKPIVGNAKITLRNDTQTIEFSLNDQDEYVWKQIGRPESLDGEPIKPTQAWYDVIVENIDAAFFYVTDLMLSAGEIISPWQQATSEILNTQVALTDQGVKVKSSVYAGDYVEITPLEFAGYSSVSGTSKKVFYINRDKTVVNKLTAENQIFMNPIKVVPSTTGSHPGWLFVASSED